MKLNIMCPLCDNAIEIDETPIRFTRDGDVTTTEMDLILKPHHCPIYRNPAALVADGATHPLVYADDALTQHDPETCDWCRASQILG